MSNAILFLNGEPPSIFPLIDDSHTIFCSDGAYHYLKANNIQPNYVVGDFDSADELSFDSKVQVIHRPDQNFTDFDKTLQFIEKHGYKELDVYGSTGQEHDHFLGNMSTALAYKNRIQLTFHDDYSVFYFTPKQFNLQGVRNKTISLIPFPKANKVTSSGLRYPLEKMNLEFGKQIGTRNHAVDDVVKISYESGELLVFISVNTKLIQPYL